MKTLGTFETLSRPLRNGIAAAGVRPGLLYSADELSEARRRAESHPQLLRHILDDAERTLASADLLAGAENIEKHRYHLDRLVEAQMVRPQERYESAILQLLRAYADAPRKGGWVAQVHIDQHPLHKLLTGPTFKGTIECDHCSANTAAAMTLAMEALGEALSVEDEEYFTQQIHEKCLRYFLRHCEERSIFWARRDYRWNWRIMTCGDAGLAALGLKGIPDRERVVEFALEGVADMLDWVPPEGDWEEGPGYWSGVLYLGLRFGLALRHATDGRVDLFQHPALVATADYFGDVMPGGPVFNYADCGGDLSPTVLYLLARETRLGHLARTARNNGYKRFVDLLFDDPTVPSTPLERLEAGRVYPSTGIAVARSDSSDGGFYVGFKSGPTDVGHSHLDIQSFVIAKGGTPLIIDTGVWPQAHQIGYFDREGGRRWDFDANAAIGHNTVLVDGEGQTYGPDHAGRIVASGSTEGLAYFVSEAASVYPGLLERFYRWVVFVAPDVVLIYDDLASGEPRHWEWLLHPAGRFSGGRANHLIENEGVKLSLTRLLPAADTPWRNTVEPRTSYYDDYVGVAVERTVDLRRFGPLFPSEEIEFLWAMHLGDPDDIRWRLEEHTSSTVLVHGEGAGRRLSLSFDRDSHTCTLGA